MSSDHFSTDDPATSEHDGQPWARPAKAKVLFVAAASALAALALFVLIYLVLARGFGSLAHDAATSFSTDLADADATVSGSPSATSSSPSKEPPAPVVPGL